jgi:AraC family transcriptional regulator
MKETQVLFELAGLRLGRFGCGPDSPRWDGENVIESRPHVVFPGTSVVIRHVGSEPVLANRNHVMFYNAGQRYRRRLHDADGDHCHFVEVAPPLLAELAGSGREVRFPFSQGPADGRLYALVAAVVRHLAHDTAETLLAEESLAHAVAGSVATAFAFHGARRLRGGPSSAAAHRTLVEQAKELLTDTATERLSLGDLGRRLHTSAYHLAHVFREGTGFTLHGYRTQLRLRLALERLRHADTDLAPLAHELGFASHSHFTDTFRRAFGVPPSALRGELAGGRLRDLRRIVEAPLRAAA